MSYDALRDTDFDGTPSVEALIEEYGLADHTDSPNPAQQAQADILEAMNQFGSQTMDDTVKRNGMWALVHALALIETEHNLDTTFDTPFDETDLIETHTHTDPIQSILHKRR